MRVDEKRVKTIHAAEPGSGEVVYWMNRDQRMKDNFALIYSQDLAEKHDKKLLVVFNLLPEYLNGGRRQLEFKKKALKELEKDLKEKNIGFEIVVGQSKEMKKWLKNRKPGILVTDFSPLKNTKSWISHIKSDIKIPFYQVDTHNVVPVWEASQKQETAARTIRPKIHKKLDEFLTDFPYVKKMDSKPKSKIDWKEMDSLKANEEVKPIEWIKPGESEAKKQLKNFVENLEGYSENRNDPVKNNLSHLSPYFHFGHLSPQRAILEVKQSDAPKKDKEEFIEEALVRRELSDNYCYYNENYDSFEGFPEWAKKTLKDHERDEREYTYTKKQFENAKTHDDLWNAAQMEMVKYGKMHGYMRMYWAKKILEWTEKPEKALEIAIYLNDKYEIDGRDPNGYVGCAWSIGGLHDRGWTERKVYGKIRYMNKKGCKRKFNVQAYIDRVMQNKEI